MNPRFYGTDIDTGVIAPINRNADGTLQVSSSGGGGGGTQEVYYYTDDPNTESVTPTNPSAPAIAIKSDGTGAIFQWNGSAWV